MPESQSLDELIAAKAAEFAEQVRATAGLADKEEEIRIEVERQLAFIEKEAGIRLEGRHEFTLARGHVDSVYDRVIIEYKNPATADRIGPTLRSPGTKRVVEQIKRRFYDMRAGHGHELNTLFGVGLDGNRIVFVRFRDDRWQEQEPVELDRHSAERFLWALFNLGEKGKPFSPEYLSGDFGSEAKLALEGVRTLYEAITTTDHPKPRTFFGQWKILFGEVCGYDVDNPSDKIKKLARSYEIPLRGLKPAELLFALQTYYALFMKLLASQIVAFFHRLATPLEKMIKAGSSQKLLHEMRELEAGGISRHFNITNFLEGDLFAWYLDVWSESVEGVVRRMVARLDSYHPGTLSEDPVASRDLLKKLYHQLFPKSVRHDLGEYYTPDWLAEHVLNELGYLGDPDKRLLDPACGSGTFLVMAINRIRAWYEEHREECRYAEDDLCRKILANVIGFDLNPLAVLAARTNYLISLRGLMHRVDRVEIPIYLCDSILTPSEYGDLFTGKSGTVKEFKTAAARFLVPTEIAETPDDVARYAEQLEFCIRHSYTAYEFLDRCRHEGLPVQSESLHTDLYNELIELDKANKNGVWARIIKNAFAPLFVGRVDYVAGNPPWVLWDNLPDEYRDSTKPIWQKYGLFTLGGTAARHGGGKKDLSALMLYASADCYLKDGGRLGFVITQTLFQSKGAGEGFRRFRIGQSGSWLRVLRVNDMTAFQPFEGASNWTSTILLQKGKRLRFPVPYIRWRVVDGLPNAATDDWRRCFERSTYSAQPIDQDRTESPWLVRPKSLKTDISRAIGPSDYSAHAGAYSGGANGVYWVRILRRVSKLVLVQNVAEKSTQDLPRIERTIEPDLLYPLITWSDVARWRAAPSRYLLLAQDVRTRRGLPEAIMRRKYARTLAYLWEFRDVLIRRAAYRRYQADAPFYSMYDIDEYTLAPIKVIWRRMDRRMNAAVVESVSDEFLGERPVIPQETCVLIEAASRDEAHYLCALLNSAILDFIVRSHSVRGGKGFGTPSILDFVHIRRYDRRNRAHKQLAALSQQAHAAALRGEVVLEGQDRIDRIAGALYGFTESEVEAIRSMQ